MRTVLSDFLGSRGYNVRAAGSGTDGLEAFQHEAFDAVVTDMKMPGLSGMDLLRGVKETAPQVPVVVMTAFGTVNTAVEAMKEGAEDFIMKPFCCEKGAGRKNPGRAERSVAPRGASSGGLAVGGKKDRHPGPGDAESS